MTCKYNKQMALFLFSLIIWADSVHMSESQLRTMNLWIMVQYIQIRLIVEPRYSSALQYLFQAVIDWLVEIFVKYFQSWVFTNMNC